MQQKYIIVGLIHPRLKPWCSVCDRIKRKISDFVRNDGKLENDLGLASLELSLEKEFDIEFNNGDNKLKPLSPNDTVLDIIQRISDHPKIQSSPVEVPESRVRLNGNPILSR